MAIADRGAGNVVWLLTGGVWSSTSPGVGFEVLAYDHSGVLYGGDINTGNIKAYSGGSWTTFWADSTYDYVYGLAADASGYLWVAAGNTSTGNSDVLKINISTKVATPVVTNVNYYYALAANGNNIWAANYTTNRIVQLQGGSGNISASGAYTIAIDSAGNGYYADAVTVKTFSGVSAGGTWSSPVYMGADASGNIYVPDNVLGKVGVYNGSTWADITHTGMTKPYAVAVN